MRLWPSLHSESGATILLVELPPDCLVAIQPRKRFEVSLKRLHIERLLLSDERRKDRFDTSAV